MDPPAGPAREGMPRWVPWLIFAVVTGTVLTLITVRFLSRITTVIGLLVFSQFVALALEPAVNWLARRGWRRGTATGAIMAAIALTVVGFFVAVLPGLVRELSNFVAGLPELIQDLAQRVGVDVSTERVQELLGERRDELANAATNLAGNVLRLTGWVLGLVGAVLAAGLISFYLTAEAPRIRRNLCSLLPPEKQVRALQLWEISIDKVGGYLYSRTFMGLIAGGATYILLRILQVPFAAPLAVFEGFVSQFVPVIGTYIGYGLPVLIALAAGGASDALWLGGFGVAYQQVENLFIGPRLSATTMNLHPAVAFVAALVGGAIGGLGGAFLALPVAAIVQAFGSTFVHRYEVVASDLTRDVTPEQAKADWEKDRRDRDQEGSFLGRLVTRRRSRG